MILPIIFPIAITVVCDEKATVCVKNVVTCFDRRKIHELRNLLLENILPIKHKRHANKIADTIIQVYKTLWKSTHSPNQSTERHNHLKSESCRAYSNKAIGRMSFSRSKFFFNELFSKNPYESNQRYGNYCNLLTVVIRKAKKNYYEYKLKTNKGNARKKGNHQ